MTARTYARQPIDIAAQMADDGLSPAARHLYLTLPLTVRIAPCGHLELQERRWARDTGYTIDQVTEALQELHDAAGRWVVIDWDTVELVIPRHIKDDGSFKNWKHVKGVYSSLERIESPALRDVVLDRIATIPDFPPPDRPIDRTTDCPIDRPIEGSMDSPYPLILDPGTSSSSANSSNSGPVDNPDDDDPPAAVDTDDPDERATAACELIGDADFERARLAGKIHGNQTGYRRACRSSATETWLRTATELADEYPTWPPDELATFIQHGADGLGVAGVGPGPPRAPTLTETTTVIDLADNGAPVVNLAAHRARTAN